MDTLFGIPTDLLTLVLLGIFAAGALILAALAARDRTSFRMAARNIPRRKSQSALIVAGLMLATVLFSAAFTTGDTLTQSLRTQALDGIGRVDVVVRAEQPDSDGGVPFGPGTGIAQAPETRERYFDGDAYGKVRDRLANEENVAGVAPLAKESMPVTSLKTNLSEPRVDVLGMDEDHMRGFDRLKTSSNETLSVGDLGKNEAYISAQTAEGLGVGVGESIEASLIRPNTGPENEMPPGSQSRQRPGATQGPPRDLKAGNPPARLEAGARPLGATGNGRPEGTRVETPPAATTREQSPPELKVAGIYEGGANPASDMSMVMPLGELQKLVGEKSKINEVLVTHRGPAVEGGGYTGETVDEINPSSRQTTSRRTR